MTAPAGGTAVFVTREGDSLWSIAALLLGDRAGEGQIAEEADRLWQLNTRRVSAGPTEPLPANTALRVD